MDGFNVRFPKVAVAAPRVNGYIVRMHARLVDAHGRRVTIRDAMLHHVVFRRRWRPRVRRECTSPTGEAFYGTGEAQGLRAVPHDGGHNVSPDSGARLLAARQRMRSEQQLSGLRRPRTRFDRPAQLLLASAHHGTARGRRRPPARRRQGHVALAAALRQPAPARQPPLLRDAQPSLLPGTADPARARTGRHRLLPIAHRHPRGAGGAAATDGGLRRRAWAPAGDVDHARVHRP
jgi:hypothetical protein